MTEQELKAKSIELIQQMVNTISNKEYTALAAAIAPKLSWADFIDAEPTLENACLGFGQWLDGQLALWEEDYGKKFVVDNFNESCLDEIALKEDNTSFVTYSPTSLGEELDFWFEIELEAKDGQIAASFDVNI